MGQVQQLYRLQQLDSEISRKKQRLAEVIQAQKETEALLGARRRAQGAADALRELERRQNDLNLELGSLNNKAGRSEERLYSGSVKNPKELSDLQSEVAALGRRRLALEDEILEIMIAVEDAQAELAAADQALAEVESAWQSSQAALREEQDQLAQRLHKLLGARKQQLTVVEEPALAKYTRLKEQKGGVAVAALEDGRCMNCHIGVSNDKVRRAESGEIVYCNSCGRILSPV